MATRIEWTRLTKDIRGLYLAVRSSVGSVASRTRRKSKEYQRILPSKTMGISPLDWSMLADLERRKNLAYLNNVRNQLR